MPLSALLLALAAAVVHATWNLLLSGTEDTHSASTVALVVGTLVFAPVALIGWRFESAALPYVAGSSRTRGALPGAALDGLLRGDHGLRLSDRARLGSGAGAGRRRGRGRSRGVGAGRSRRAPGGGRHRARARRATVGSGRPRDLALALSVGACIAGYTLVDKRGIVHAAPVAYLEVVFGLTAIVYVLGAWRVRGAAALRAAVGWRTVLAGVGFFGAYALTLAALRLAPAASVAAVRESSVVMAAVALALGGREEMGPERFAGAAAVVAGIALISLG